MFFTPDVTPVVAPVEHQEAPQELSAWHSPGLHLESLGGLALVDAVRALLEEREERIRGRRESAEESWRRVVMSLTAGLVKAHLGGYAGGLAVELGKPREPRVSSRYDVPALPPPTMNEAAALLEQTGLATVVKGRWRKPAARRSSLHPTRRFAELVSAHGVELEDVEDLSGSEIIVLRDPKPDRWAIRGPNAPYNDDKLTMELRQELEEVNGWLVEADLSIAEGGPRVDLTDRRMRRVFNRTMWPPEGYQDFTLGGRLYGGFWQPMRSAHRLRYLRIDGQRIVIVDWASAFLRMAYAEQRMEPPKGDLYGFRPKAQRPGIKQAVGALLSAPRVLKHFPKGLQESFPRERWADVKGEIFRAHPPVEELAGSSFGLRAMYLESRALLLALRELHHQGITALPIHDGIAVSHLHATAALDTMKEAFREVVGIEGKAGVEVGTEE